MITNAIAWFGAIAIVGVSSLVALKFLPTPFLWISVSSLVTLIILFKHSRKSTQKGVFLNLAVVVIVLGLGEFYFLRNESPQSGSDSVKSTYTEGYFDRSHKILGYAPTKGKTARATKYHNDELVYDVIYTIDDKGLRISPPAIESADSCILFFGGSFTIGEGVLDEETLPYRVGVLTQGRFQVYNFGFHGYGAHQMLAALESGIVADTIACEPRYAFYHALDRHVFRTSGLSGWGKNTPRYVLGSDGLVTHAGSFEDFTLDKMTNILTKQLNKSAIFRKLVERIPSLQVNDEQVETFAAIVETARRHILALNPSVEFHVILWNFDARLTRRVVSEFQARQLSIHTVRGHILPTADYKSTYALGPYDHHPNATTYDRLARYVIAEVIR